MVPDENYAGRTQMRTPGKGKDMNQLDTQREIAAFSPGPEASPELHLMAAAARLIAWREPTDKTALSLIIQAIDCLAGRTK
jgi:hypothetical protein